MNLKTIMITLAIFVLILQWPMLNYERADAKLNEFYTQVAAANFGGARESINEAIRLSPNNARYYAWRAYCTSQPLPSQCPRRLPSGNSALVASDRQIAQDAIHDYRHALELNSRDAVAHHNLAWLEHLLGDDEAAAKDWRESIEIDPDTAVFHLSYGIFLDDSGNADAGRDQYETAIELSPSILDSPFFTRYRARFPDSAVLIARHCIAHLESQLQMVLRMVTFWCV